MTQSNGALHGGCLCGTVTYEITPPFAKFAGSLDDSPGESPKARLFCGSEAAWACAGDDVPRYEEYPEWW